jgi:hypothetical protein
MISRRGLVTSDDFVDAFDDVAVLGICGENGAGKDVLMNALVGAGFWQYNVGSALREVTMASLGSTMRGGNNEPVGRVANRNRALYPGGMVDVGLLNFWTIAGHIEGPDKPKGVVIGSIRGADEIKGLHRVGGLLIAVRADESIRYERKALRAHQGRHEDMVSFEVWKEHERQEMAEFETNPKLFSMHAVIQAADITIWNNGTAKEFEDTVNKAFVKHGVKLPRPLALV